LIWFWTRNSSKNVDFGKIVVMRGWACVTIDIQQRVCHVIKVKRLEENA